MYIAYVDESGDDGHNVAITQYFTLSGIILADSNWKIFLEKMKVFRQGLKIDFGLTLKADLRATDLWRNRGDFRRLSLSYADRTRIFTRTAEFLRSSQEITILTVSINKGSPQLTPLPFKNNKGRGQGDRVTKAVDKSSIKAKQYVL